MPNPIKPRRFILATLLTLFLTALVINNFISEETAFLSGEYVFSFDYRGHIENILSDFSADRSTLLNVATCIDCPLIYLYSRWYSLIKYYLLNTGGLFGYNPFVWYILLIISLQLLSLYIFVNTFFRDFNRYTFFVASFLFIFSPYRFFGLSGGSIDSINHAIIVFSFTFLIYSLKRLPLLNIKSVVAHAALIGAFFSFSLNISIGYFPIILYSTLLVFLYFSKTLISNFPKVIILVSIIGLITTVINLPMVLSFLKSGNPRTFSDYNSLLIPNALTAGMFEAGGFIFTGLLFLTVIFLYFKSFLSKQTKIYLFTGHLFVSILMMGNKIPLDIYRIVFYYLPFMRSLRALHRLIFLELLIIFIVVYTGLIALQKTHTFRNRTILYICSLILVFIPAYIIYRNINFIYVAKVPEEYFEVDKYFEHNNEKKIYFPAYVKRYQTMQGNYTWLKSVARHKTVYTNPFSSLFALPNLATFEAEQSSLNNWEQRALTDYQLRPSEIIEALEYQGVKYLIFDNNFLWSKNFPSFDFDGFKNQLKLDKQFGNIYIFMLDDKRGHCKTAYGDYLTGYCTTISKKPQYLVNKSKKEYYLDLLEINGSGTIEMNKSLRFLPLIYNEEFKKLRIEKRLLIPFDMYQINGDVKDIFVKKIPSGRFRLLMPLFKVSKLNNAFKDSNIEVTLDESRLKTVNPYSVKYGLHWEEVELENKSNKDSLLSINSKGTGFVILGKPLLFSTEDWQGFTRQLSADKYTPTLVDTYSTTIKDITVKINDQDLDNTEKVGSYAEVNLLLNKYVEGTPNYKNFSIDPSGYLNTPKGLQALEYNLTYTKKLKQLQIVFAAYNLKPDRTAQVKIVDTNGNTLFSSIEFFQGENLNLFDIPSDAVKDRNSFKIKLETNNQTEDKIGPTIYTFGLILQFNE